MIRNFRCAGAAIVALTLVACGESPTGPTFQTSRVSFDGVVVIACDPALDPGCVPGGNPIDVLVSALTAQINELNLPPIVKARLIGAVNQIPTRLAGLTPAQKIEAIQRTERLINLVRSLTPQFIPAVKADAIITLANQVIAALRV